MLPEMYVCLIFIRAGSIKFGGENDTLIGCDQQERGGEKVFLEDGSATSRMILIYTNPGILFLANADSTKAGKFNIKRIEIGEKKLGSSTLL